LLSSPWPTTLLRVSTPPSIPLLVILGPTASGKSSLGLEVAETLGGEIISADAFAVYRGLDIGTDKPTLEERARIPHHLIDVAEPTERFSAGIFAAKADEAIDNIRARGNLPLVVGGTHFYIRALLLGLFPSPPHDPDVRAQLTEAWKRDPVSVVRRMQEVDPASAERIGPRDRQRVLRALEVFELTGEPLSSHWNRHDASSRYVSLLTAPRQPRADLYARIDARVELMFASGLVEEVEDILASGVPPDAHALKAIGYREVVGMLRGEIDREEAIDLTKRSSRQLAKRQLTWLRNLSEGTLHWVPAANEGGASEIVALWNRRFNLTGGGR